MNLAPIRHVLLATVWLAVAGMAQAHALRHAVSGQDATTVSWHYDDGRPLAGAVVTVFAPDKAEAPFQEGTTDRSGRFSFVPDDDGRWQITVNDGMGHRADVFIEVDDTGRSDATAPASAVSPGRVLVGVGVLFGGFGLWALFAARRNARVPPGPAA